MNIEDIFLSLGQTPIERLLTMMARLRDPNTGCPWDKEQNFKTIAPYTIEEAYEVSDAIDRGDMNDLRTELGDLLLQVVFHAQMAKEDKLFDFDDVSDGLVRKMISRHPHVFGESKQENTETQTGDWEDIKASERETDHGYTSILDGVAMALPALMRAEKLQKRAARVGFDWPHAEDVLAKVTEEAKEIVDAQKSGDTQAHIHEEIGDLLFVLANLSRKLKVDPEHALRDANRKFTNRFHYIEQNAPKPLSEMKLDEIEELWIES
ncbi:MAG TPA: nucleoside triphosphate pyrophosphohydrolase, partial [Hellea balneolensis]|nr:nucleoside triphosphate pyrophosphohydrolase [Hellea balneolensis]